MRFFLAFAIVAVTAGSASAAVAADKEMVAKAQELLV